MERTQHSKPSSTLPQRDRSGRERYDPVEAKRKRVELDTLLRNTSARTVAGDFGLSLKGEKWTDFRLNDVKFGIKASNGCIKVLNGHMIPGIGKGGAPADTSVGAINLVIALSYLTGQGNVTKYEDAKAYLQEHYHPATLSADYRPAQRSNTPLPPPPPPPKPVPAELPEYAKEVRPLLERYLTETRCLPADVVKHLIDERMAYPSLRHWNYADRKHRLVVMPDTEKNRTRMEALRTEAKGAGTTFVAIEKKKGSTNLTAKIGAIGNKTQMKAKAGALDKDEWHLNPKLGDLIAQWQEEDAAATPAPASIEVTRNPLPGTPAPTIVFPYVHVYENFATGFEHKEIPLDLKGKTKGVSCGPRPESVFILGCLNAKTKHLHVTEAPIDAVSKWVLDQSGDDTCVVATIGAHLVPALIEKAKKVGADVEIALDCDEAGTKVARQYAKECQKQGVPFHYNFPKQSEAVVDIPNANGVGEKRLTQLVAHCQKLGLPTRISAKETKDLLRVCVGNTLETWDLLHSWKDDDKLRETDSSNSAADRARIQAEPKFKVNVERNKDWNDLLKGSKAPLLDWTPAPPPPLVPHSPVTALVAPGVSKNPHDVEV